MSKTKIKTRNLVITFAFLLVSGVASLALATSAVAHEDGTEHKHELTDQRKTATQQKLEELAQQAKERREQQKNRLEQTKLRACQNREKAINGIMSRISTRGEKRIGVINKISERVQAFYVEKGRTVANYDALVAEVNAKKADAQATLAAIKSSSVEFKCDGSDPKGAGQLFKDNLKLEIAALKEYKTAVKNLIVAVKSANSSSEGSE